MDTWVFRIGSLTVRSTDQPDPAPARPVARAKGSPRRNG